MKELSSTIIRTTCGKPFDLRKAAPIASNATAPYGNHNFIVYKTSNGFYLKGYNSGNAKTLLDVFELISHHQAMRHLQEQTANRQQSPAYR
ncbi:hypothetical protein [Adhaeribacter soli]|uniref:Uncharacterized protein n=1 Tax=Adhaeribacter soli TaxID=2607655 RepID=A0A5N1J2C2_9BACT|nr:hypothetical protein [Adhaeribacter soli]KAA9340729.1 hypothetical protein F0P94_04695 [Adhaeribacter soli]